MARASRKLAIAHLAQHAAERLLGDNDAEFLENPLAKIDDPPVHHPMNRRDRPALEDCGQRPPMLVVQPRRLPRRLAIDRAFPTMRSEPDHPIANDLQSDGTDLRRLGAARAVVNRRQRQKPPGLRPILRSLGRGPHHLSVIIGPNRNGHGEPPLFATLNQNPADSGIHIRVTLSRTGYKARVSSNIFVERAGAYSCARGSKRDGAFAYA